MHDVETSRRQTSQIPILINFGNIAFNSQIPILINFGNVAFNCNKFRPKSPTNQDFVYKLT